jgi:hypothetical protein
VRPERPTGALTLHAAGPRDNGKEQATELSVAESGAAFIVLSGARVEVADS